MTKYDILAVVATIAFFVLAIFVVKVIFGDQHEVIDADPIAQTHYDYVEPTVVRAEKRLYPVPPPDEKKGVYDVETDSYIR